MRKVVTILATAIATSCALVGRLDEYRLKVEPSDASTDALGDDGAVVRDGGAGSDGAAPSICEVYSDAQFCDDFDVPPLGARWDEVKLLDGSLAIDASSPFSAPYFLEATVGPQSQNGFGPRLRKHMGPRDAISIRARIRIEPGKTSIPVRIDVQTAQSHDIRLEHSGGATHIEEVNYTLSDSKRGQAFTKSLDDTWQEVVIHIAFKTRKVDVTIGGVAALVGQDLVLGDWSGTPNVAVHVGLPFVIVQATTVTSGIDDVVLLSE